MNATNPANGVQAATQETLVVIKEGTGYKVYNPANAEMYYFVSGTKEAPNCSCLDFQNYRNVPNYRCPHIQAVFNGNGNPASSPDPYDQEERRAIQEEARVAELEQLVSQIKLPPHMILKRSVSPDGRIDSLSIEFSSPVTLIEPGNAKAEAEKIMALQSEIAALFLNHATKQQSNGGNGQSQNHQNSNDYVIIQLTHIAGSQTKYGWRQYINARVNGKDVRLYGDHQKLSGFLRDAGYPDLGNNIHEGNQLNVQCRASIKHDPNNKYPVIEKLLPLNGINR